MGVASSTLIMRPGRGLKTERLKSSASASPFQRWSLVDVRRALDQYGHCAHAFESRPGSPPCPSKKRRPRNFIRSSELEDYYRVT